MLDLDSLIKVREVANCWPDLIQVQASIELTCKMTDYRSYPMERLKEECVAHFKQAFAKKFYGDLAHKLTELKLKCYSRGGYSTDIDETFTEMINFLQGRA